MASSKKKVLKKNSLKKEINNLKQEHNKVVDDIISSTIYKKDIQKIIDQKNIECKKSRTFLRTLETTVISEKAKISEFEGAILALNQLLTGKNSKVT